MDFNLPEFFSAKLSTVPIDQTLYHQSFYYMVSYKEHNEPYISDVIYNIWMWYPKGINSYCS